MKLPKQPLDREAFYQDLVERCLVSRQDRIAEYDRLRHYYLFGSNLDSDPAVYNKIYPAIDQISSFLFAADTTRFTIKLGAGADKAELMKVPPLTHRLNDKWQDSNCDIVFGGAVTWSQVYGCMIVKLVTRGNDTHPFVIEPHNFGVLQEEVPMLDRQEAFVHVFQGSRPQLARDLEAHPNKESILSRLTARVTNDNALPAGVQRIITSSFYPTMQGNVNTPLAGADMYRPQTQEELVEMYELWVWNDETEDYQVVTLADPQVCIYDRPSGREMFIPKEHPFTQVCPDPATDYFWGYSAVARLTGLQDEREHHMRQVRELVDRNVNSPKAATGMWGAVEEKTDALQRLNAIIASTDPIAKIQEFKPELPHDMWAVINEIDEMFQEAIALSRLSRGEGDTGVRSKGQTDSLLRVGSSRSKKRALVLEDSLERIATQYLLVDQYHDPEPLHDTKGQKFISDQFTKDFQVRVDAHSSSPVFTEDQTRNAVELFKLGVIDGEELLNVLQPQNVDILIEKWKAMAAAKAKAEDEQRKIEQGVAADKALRSVR